MLYVHESNILNKISTNYNGKRTEIQQFYDSHYIPMRKSLLKLTFAETNIQAFKTATDIFNEYSKEINAFSMRYNIKSQSKFASTYLEEISSYLFKDIPEIRSGELGIFNKKIYAGLKIDNNKRIGIITKDVDFCIGKKVNISIDDQLATELILPVVAVEVKTYLDATMFGEVKSSSKAIRSASPNSKAYVLMGYKDLADEHIIAARQDSALTEMFALRGGPSSPIDVDAVFYYWKEIESAVTEVANLSHISVPGRLLR